MKFLNISFHKLIFLVAVFFILVPYVGDNDFWLHLRTGEIMVENGYFPRTDVLSFTNQNEGWVNHEWLSQIIFYSTFKYGGFSTVSLLTALAGTLIFLLMLAKRKLSGLVLASLFLVAYSLKPFIVPRPQIFAYLLLLGLILAIEWYYQTKNKKIIFILPAILFLWASIHASVILALPIFLTVLVFEFGPLAKFNRSALDYREKMWLASAMGLALVFSLANPFGFKIYWQALQPLRFSAAFNFLIETQPIYKAPYYPAILLTHLGIIFAVFWHIFKRGLSVLRPYEVVIFVLFSTMPFIAVKYIPFAWVVITPIFLKILPNLKNKLAVNLMIVGIAIVSMAIFIGDGNLFKDPHSEWPKEMAEFIKDNNLKGNMYNPFSWSGYFAWENKTPVFINPALADLGGDVFWDALDFDKGEKTEEIINKYNLSVVVSQPWTILPYSLSLREGWSLIYWDNYGVVFAKKGYGNDEIIKKYGLDIKYFNDSVGSVLSKYKASEIPILVKNYKEAIKRQPDLLLARYRLGLIYKLSGNCLEAIEQFKEITRIDIKLASTHFRLVECYRELGDLRSAISEKNLADKFKGKEKWWKGRI